MDKEIITKIKALLEEEYKNSDNSAAGYDEGYYNGKIEAFEEVLKILENH